MPKLIRPPAAPGKLTNRPSPEWTPARKRELLRYDVKRFKLIPLYRPYATLTDPKGRVRDAGKMPLHRQWDKRKYVSEETIERAFAENRNVGVRLPETLLIVDVDFRAGGKKGFANLCADIGIDEDKYPRVITGSGSFHVYMTKPLDWPVCDTLESDDYDGCEFKSKGRQVVAAGSLHPNGTPYRWSRKHPPIEDGIPPAPKHLLQTIKRPAHSAVTGGGQYTREQIGIALSRLDVADFDTNDTWFPLMQACHHASAGDARQEFIDWSTGDERFAQDAFIIGKRWDSLHADRNGGVTYRTLNKILRDAGAADAQVAADVADDEFPDGVDDVEDIRDTHTKVKDSRR